MASPALQHKMRTHKSQVPFPLEWSRILKENDLKGANDQPSRCAKKIRKIPHKLSEKTSYIKKLILIHTQQICRKF